MEEGLNEKLVFSLIVPVYNRPDEIDELLESLTKQDFSDYFEVVIVEDGSTNDAKSVIEKYKNSLSITYHFKENSGPGDSRNFGMQNAAGNYFIILDSDCILPEEYLTKAHNALQSNFVDCFGGPDNAHHSFSDVQKAINYAMTAFITTGGIRGKEGAVNKFQPRSFNMGISKKAFLKTNGFGNIHPGEDPDLTIRLWNEGFESRLIPEAFVYHKRRISWSKFHTQVNKFGKVRPILNLWHPSTAKITYWFPTVFCIGFIISALAFLIGIPYLLGLYAIYFAIVFIDALMQNKNLKIAAFALLAVGIQFVGYGFGFLNSTYKLKILKKDPETDFPELFFKKPH